MKVLVTRNTHVQYESPITSGKKVMAKGKVFVHAYTPTRHRHGHQGYDISSPNIRPGLLKKIGCTKFFMVDIPYLIKMQLLNILLHEIEEANRQRQRHWQNQNHVLHRFTFWYFSTHTQYLIHVSLAWIYTSVLPLSSIHVQNWAA